jgi:hypothetical protein
VRELQAGALGAACARVVAAAGLDPSAPLAAVDDAFAPAGTLLRRLGPDAVLSGIPSQAGPRPVPARRRPHYSWTRTMAAVADGSPG